MSEISELQLQLIHLCEELRKEQQEKSEAVAEIEILELEVHDAKESEKKLLESLLSQTKKLEQAKIALEESKLEIQRLRMELMHAMDAEENMKNAMDDLAIALKEVTIESNRAKKSYFQTQSELEKLQVETERLRSEADESSTAWRAKENGFINCINVSEEEISYIKKENKRLTESKKAAREEIFNLRDILKHAVKEYETVKEALETAHSENLQLKNVLSIRENGFKSNNESYESTKVDKTFVKFPSENWSLRWNSIRDTKLLEGSIFDVFAPTSPKREDFDDINEINEGDSPMRLKKKKQGLRKIGEMLRMRSFNIK